MTLPEITPAPWRPETEIHYQSLEQLFPLYKKLLDNTPDDVNLGNISTQEAIQQIVYSVPPELQGRYTAIRLSPQQITMKENGFQEILKEAQTLGFLPNDTSVIPASENLKVLDLVPDHLRTESGEKSLVTLLLPPPKHLLADQVNDNLYLRQFFLRVSRELQEKYELGEILVTSSSFFAIAQPTNDNPAILLHVYNDFLLSQKEARTKRNNEIEMMKRLTGGPFPQALPELIDTIQIPEVTTPLKTVHGDPVEKIIWNLAMDDMEQPTAYQRLVRRVIPSYKHKPQFGPHAIDQIIDATRLAQQFAHERKVELGHLNARLIYINPDEASQKNELRVICLDLSDAEELTPEGITNDEQQLIALKAYLTDMYTKAVSGKIAVPDWL